MQELDARCQPIRFELASTCERLAHLDVGIADNAAQVVNDRDARRRARVEAREVLSEGSLRIHKGQRQARADSFRVNASTHGRSGTWSLCPMSFVSMDAKSRRVKSTGQLSMEPGVSQR